MSEHTPTPWQQHDNAASYGESYAPIVWGPAGPGYGVVADLRGCGTGGRSEAIANAAFIVEAVNNHDALVKFLKILLAHDDRFQVAVGGNPRIVDAMLAEGRALLGAVGQPQVTRHE